MNHIQLLIINWCGSYVTIKLPISSRFQWCKHFKGKMKGGSFFSLYEPGLTSFLPCKDGFYLLARRNLLWDILRLPSSRRAALGLYVILTLWRGRGANQPPYTLLHRSSPRYALRHGRRQWHDSNKKKYICVALLLGIVIRWKMNHIQITFIMSICKTNWMPMGIQCAIQSCRIMYLTLWTMYNPMYLMILYIWCTIWSSLGLCWSYSTCHALGVLVLLTSSSVHNENDDKIQ